MSILKNIPYCILLFCFLLPIGCRKKVNEYVPQETFSLSQTNATWKWVESSSLIQIISNPSVYDGTNVMIDGYLSITKERTALFLLNDCNKRICKKEGVLLNIPDKWRDSLEPYKDSYCIVVGIFASSEKGSLNAYSGSITNVFTISCYEYIPQSRP